MKGNDSTAKPPAPLEGSSNKRPQTQNSKSVFDQALKFLEKAPITEHHVTQIIDSVSKIAEMKLEQGIKDAEAVNKIRLMMVQFQNDTKRCENAIDYLREFKELLSEQELGQLVSAIIKVQIGVSPDKI